MHLKFKYSKTFEVSQFSQTDIYLLYKSYHKNKRKIIPFNRVKPTIGGKARRHRVAPRTRTLTVYMTRVMVP